MTNTREQGLDVLRRLVPDLPFNDQGELRLHLPIALRNGLTRDELEEVIYHAAAYAGFPAASTAGRIGQEVLG